MIGYVGKQRPARVVMVTECSMSDNVAAEFPTIDFVRPCNLCPHMKRITLPKILHSLRDDDDGSDRRSGHRGARARRRRADAAVKMPEQRAAA